MFETNLPSSITDLDENGCCNLMSGKSESKIQVSYSRNTSISPSKDFQLHHRIGQRQRYLFCICWIWVDLLNESNGESSIMGPLWRHAWIQSFCQDLSAEDFQPWSRMGCGLQDGEIEIRYVEGVMKDSIGKCCGEKIYKRAFDRNIRPYALWEARCR